MAVIPQPTTIAKAAFEETSTTALFRLNEGTDDSWGGKWRYVQASGAISAFDAVKIDNDGQAAALTTTISGDEPTMVGLAQVAFADNDYGWVFVGPGAGLGSGVKVNALTLCATNVKLYTTGTAGAIDDSATDLIAGLTIVATNSGGTTAAVEVLAATSLCTNCQD